MNSSTLKMLDAKRKTLFSIIQGTLELGNSLDKPEFREAFEIKLQTVDSIKKEFSQVLDEINLEKMNLNPDYVPSYKYLESMEQIFAQIKYKESQLNVKIKPESIETKKNIGKLPPLQLVSFSGDPTNWTIFYQNFKELIYENKQLSDAEKSQYLTSKLSGKASILIASIRSEERRVGKECRSRWSPYH